MLCIFQFYLNWRVCVSKLYQPSTYQVGSLLPYVAFIVVQLVDEGKMIFDRLIIFDN